MLFRFVIAVVTFSFALAAASPMLRSPFVGLTNVGASVQPMEGEEDGGGYISGKPDDSTKGWVVMDAYTDATCTTLEYSASTKIGACFRLWWIEDVSYGMIHRHNLGQGNVHIALSTFSDQHCTMKVGDDESYIFTKNSGTCGKEPYGKEQIGYISNHLPKHGAGQVDMVFHNSMECMYGNSPELVFFYPLNGCHGGRTLTACYSKMWWGSWWSGAYHALHSNNDCSNPPMGSHRQMVDTCWSYDEEDDRMAKAVCVRN